MAQTHHTEGNSAIQLALSDENRELVSFMASKNLFINTFQFSQLYQASVCSLSDPAHNHPITTYTSRKHMCCFNCQKWKKQQNFDSGPCTFTQSLMEGLSVT